MEKQERKAATELGCLGVLTLELNMPKAHAETVDVAL